MNDSAESRPLTFGELGVPGPLVRVLAADDKKTAFPIQADTLPDSLAGRDILGRGRTGSGKTLAFSIPLVTRLGSYDSFGEIAMEEFRKEIKRRKKASLEERRADDFLPHPRGLVLAPTRELANQINDVLMPLAHTFGMNTTTVYGGVKYIHQIRDLKAGADIVVACPAALRTCCASRRSRSRPSKSWSSMRPTKWPIWASCRRSSDCLSRFRPTPSTCCSPPRSITAWMKW